MSKKTFAAVLLFFLSLVSCFEASAKTNHKNRKSPFIQNEKLVIGAMSALHSAQVTYQAINSSGNFGTFADLRQADLIDSAMALGFKYGYVFSITKTDFAPNTTATFYITATPRVYRKTGRKSFYIAVPGELHGADKNGSPANADDPVIELCYQNEECAISGLRRIHSAQITYQATVGNGNFGSFNQLYAAGLLNSRLATGYAHGYTFTYLIIARTEISPAAFKIMAVPENYGATGVRSFFIDTSGVLRGADKNGAPADETDPPIDF